MIAVLSLACLGGYSQAPEPLGNPTSMQFSNIKPFALNMSFSPAVATGYLVLKSDKPIIVAPVDGTVYQKGQGVSGCKVLSFGPDSSFNVREVLEGTKYYFCVFAFNGSGANINYKQSNPLIDSVTSTPADPGNYYASIDSSSGTFLSDLHALINVHQLVSYSAYKTNILPVIYERDTINGQAVVNCEYSDTTTIYTPPFDFTATDYNREHSLPKSWMLTGGNTSNADGADYHNLLLTKATPNNMRSNHPLGEVVSVTSSYGLSKLGNDAGGNPVFEPQENRKGNDARDMFYQMICYNGNSGTWGFNYMLTEAPNQDQNVLKQWNLMDLPDKFERTRNEYVYSIQHNRNPFVDHPEWATCINFDSIIKTNLCGAISSIHDEVLNVGINLFPNPAKDVLALEVTSDNDIDAKLEVFDLWGRSIVFLSASLQNGLTTIHVPVSEIQNGIYLLKLSDGNRFIYRKFEVVR